MANIESRLDRFCRKHPKFAIPRLVQYILIGSIVVYALDFITQGVCTAWFSFVPALIFQGQIWRLVTFILLPLSPDPLYFILGVYATWWISSAVEREWGAGKLTLFYTVGLVLNILAGLAVGLVFLSLGIPPVFSAASVFYLNLSLLFAFATLFPNAQLLFFFVLPIKAKWIGWLNAALFAYAIFEPVVSAGGLIEPLWLVVQILPPILAIANYFLFFWGDIVGFFANIFRTARHRSARQTINFKKSVKETKQTRGYLHKCDVCGRTDADNPGLDFRYCSKCEGYHCYCSDHINSHDHIR